MSPLRLRNVCFTLIERKSKVSQLQGVQGRSCGRPPRALGNEEDGMASAFPKGKQHGKNFFKLCLINSRYIEFEKT